MNMAKYLKGTGGWLNNSELQARGGHYAGEIREVIEQACVNRFARDKAPQLQPVIVFADGLRLVPNLEMRRELVTRFGEETDRWKGRQLTIVWRAGRTNGTKHFVWHDEDNALRSNLASSTAAPPRERVDAPSSDEIFNKPFRVNGSPGRRGKREVQESDDEIPF
jgi:hypothetical protein